MMPDYARMRSFKGTGLEGKSLVQVVHSFENVNMLACSKAKILELFQPNSYRGTHSPT